MQSEKIFIKRIIALFLVITIEAGMCLTCANVVKASGNESSENTVTEQQQSEFVKSKHMWDYNGMVYTVNDIHKENFYSVSGKYVDTMLIYKDKIYWRKTTELGHFPCDLIQMNMDSTDQKVLTDSVDSYAGMEVYDDYLYYVSLGKDDKRTSRKINLKTMEEEDAPPYILRAGDENIWFVNSLTEDDHKLYQTEPGFKNPQPLDEIKGNCLGVYNGILYYMNQEDDATYTTKSYDFSKSEIQILIEGNKFKSIVSGKGLYYKKIEDGKVTLYRQDLQTGTKKEYGFGSFNVYMGGGLHELGEDLYFTRYCPEQEEDNTELWKISLTNGNPEKISSGYSPNAEAAAEE